MTVIEKGIVAAIIGLVALIVMIAVFGGGIDLNDMRQLCLLKGGIPIQNEAGRLVRCDFPVTIER